MGGISFNKRTLLMHLSSISRSITIGFPLVAWCYCIWHITVSSTHNLFKAYLDHNLRKKEKKKKKKKKKRKKLASRMPQSCDCVASNYVLFRYQELKSCWRDNVVKPAGSLWRVKVGRKRVRREITTTIINETTRDLTGHGTRNEKSSSQSSYERQLLYWMKIPRRFCPHWHTPQETMAIMYKTATFASYIYLYSQVTVCLLHFFFSLLK